MTDLYPDPMLSRPVRIRWAGWETDTYRLQRAGWSLSANQNVQMHSMRLAFEHREYRAQGYTDVADWHYFYRDPAYVDHVVFPAGVMMGREIHMHVIEERLYEPHEGWQAVDAVPQLRGEIKTLADHVHFAPAPKQVIVPADTVPDLMERIMKLQQPAREKNLRLQSHIQLVSTA